MRKLRVGSVPYINAAPLTRWLETDEATPFVEVVYAPPSVLARQLQARELDVALVSSVELARREDARSVADLCIGSRDGAERAPVLQDAPAPTTHRRAGH
jgi:predicted solute-binding protein